MLLVPYLVFSSTARVWVNIVSSSLSPRTQRSENFGDTYLLILEITPKQIIKSGLRISYLTEAWECWFLQNLTNMGESCVECVVFWWSFSASVLVLNGAT